MDSSNSEPPVDAAPPRSGALRDRRRGLAPFALGLAVAVIFWGGFQLLRTTVPPGEVWLGWTFYDIPSYYANAREVFENGNGIFYANPYSIEKNSPRIFTNLQIDAMAWLWKLGVGFQAQEFLWRLVSLPLIFGFLWWIVAAYVPPGKARYWTYAMAAFGGGFAVIPALESALVIVSKGGFPEGMSTLAAFFHALGASQQLFEGRWGWWFLNPLRNILYSTECFYHALFFATIAAVLRRKWTVAITCFILTWWAHPFTALELGTFLWTWTMLESWIEWRRERRLGTFFRQFVAISIVNAVFLIYYGPLMATSEEQRSLVAIWRGPEALRISTAPLTHVFLSYGPLLLGLLWAFGKEGRLAARTSPFHRLLLVWAGVVFVLMHHDKLRFVEHPAQPLHFSRGYLYLVLTIWSGLWVRRLLMLHSSAWKWILGGAAAVLLCALGDNALFFGRYFGGGARNRGILYIPDSEYAMFKRLDAFPGHGVVFTIEPHPTHDLGYLINTYTAHRSFLGHGTNSPYLRDRLSAYLTWMAKPEGWFLDRIDAKAVAAQLDYLDSRPWVRNGDGPGTLEGVMGSKFRRVSAPEGYALWVRKE